MNVPHFISRSPRRVGIVLAIATIALATVAALLLRHDQTPQPPAPPEPPAVGVIELREQTVSLTSELPGRVVAREISEVRPQVSGVIRQRLFEEGATVQEGQLLYVIEDAPYRAAVVSAEGRLAEATATIQSTRSKARRYDALLSQAAISRQDAEVARDAYAQAQASVRTQRGALDAARADLGFTRILAPISGSIGRSFVTVGALVQAGQLAPLALINRTDEVYVDVRQSADRMLDLRDSYDSGNLGPDEDPATAKMRLILPNGRAYAHDGTLRFSEAVVDPTTGSVAMRALFPNPDGKLLPGMAVRVVFTEGIRQRAILVPQQGITRDAKGGGIALVVGDDDRVVRKAVVADRTVGSQWLVTAGLSAGDRLVVDGLSAAQPGQRVRPVAPQHAMPGVPDEEASR
ncbi:efflux RND transporter periplasmic adaptor subunit [Azotobacter vinelandii]|uniref:efflux RND transporter periplasmic adaptor subunit n=1 Tax=Azotobacter vinelandii TaxID=354 RepID=UPI000917E305|nr:efflux RND transporter periplasmic adaptor subunit [Azotobacter vinelandii]SFX80536.1 membrane fusion protein, multidrug efflux system [Azotobacter vinelandii]